MPCRHLQLSSALHLQTKEMVSWSLSAWKLTRKDFELHCPMTTESHSVLLSVKKGGLARGFMWLLLLGSKQKNNWVLFSNTPFSVCHLRMHNTHNDLKIAIKFCANRCKRFSAMLRALGRSITSWLLPLLRPPWKLLSNFFCVVMPME